MVSLASALRRFSLPANNSTMKKNFDDIFEELKSDLPKNFSLIEVISILQMLNETNADLFFNKRNVWLPLMIKLCVNSSNKVREKSLELFEKLTLPSEESDFLLMKETLKKVMPDFIKLIPDNGPYSFKFWKFLLNVFGDALQKSASLLNVMLPPIEAAFKSENQTIKCLAFESWSCLIKNLSSSNIGYISEPKRLNLIMQPLIVGSRRSERVAIEQVKTWMVLLTVFGSDLETYFDQICAPLLRFCVGGECETIQNSASAGSSPQLNRSFRTPASPQTPKLYLTNADRSVGPKKLPCFPSVQAFLGEILLDFLCGPVQIAGFSRSLNYLPIKSCVQTSVTIEKHLSLLSQSLRIWAASASKNDEVLLRCWEALSNCVIDAKLELSYSSFDSLTECFCLQFGQFLDECVLDSHTKASLIKFKNNVAAVSLEIAENQIGPTCGQSSNLIERQSSTEFNTTEKLIGSLNVPSPSLCTPPSQKNLNSKPIVNTSSARSTRLRKKLNLEQVQNEEEFVYIPPAEKKKTIVLTEHQKEKFLERKEMPYLDQNNSQTIENVNQELFRTESQLLDPEVLVVLNDPVANASSSASSTDSSGDVELIEQVAVPTTMVKTPKQKKPTWLKNLKRACTPTVLVEKLTDHEIEILTQETAAADTNLIKKTLKDEEIEILKQENELAATNFVKKPLKKRPKSKSETDLPCDEELSSDPDIVLSSQPAVLYRLRSSKRKDLGELNVPVVQKKEPSVDVCVLIPDSYGADHETSVGVNEEDANKTDSTHEQRSDNTIDESNGDDRITSPLIELVTENDANLKLNDINVCRIYPLIQKTSKISLSQPCETKISASEGSSNLSPFRSRAKESDDDERNRLTRIRPLPSLNENNENLSQNVTADDVLQKICEIEVRSLKLDADGLLDFPEIFSAHISSAGSLSPMRENIADTPTVVSESFTNDVLSAVGNECGPIVDDSVCNNVANESRLDESDDDVAICAIVSSNKMFSPCSTPSASSILKKRKRALAQVDDYRVPISLTPPSSAGRRQVHFDPELISNSDDEQQQIKVTPRKRARLDLSPPPESADPNSKRTFCKPQSLFAKKFSARTHAMISRINLCTKSKPGDLNESSSFVSTGESVCLTRESVLDNSQPIWPSLVDNSTDVGVIISSLVSSSWDAGLLQELNLKNILTIGHLARLTELDVHHLPIKQPKIETIKHAFMLFEKNNKNGADLDNSDLNISGVVPMEEELDKSSENISQNRSVENIESDKEQLNKELNRSCDENVADSEPVSEEKKNDVESIQNNSDYEPVSDEDSADADRLREKMNSDSKRICEPSINFDLIRNEKSAEKESVCEDKCADTDRTTPSNRPASTSSSSNTTLPSGQPDYSFLEFNRHTNQGCNAEVQTDAYDVNVNKVDSIIENIQKLLSEENVCKLSKDEKFKLYNFFEKSQRCLFVSTFEKE